MYFFIDSEKLTNQIIGDSYGPDNTNSTTQYNVTSRFQLTEEAKVFACEYGTMMVQQSTVHNSLVNLIIRPSNLNKDTPIDVQYYIYRGVLKNSLIDDSSGCSILTQDPSNNDLIKRIRLDPNMDDYTCKQLGYDNILGVTELINDFFSYKNLTVSPIVIKEGEWIGTFTKDYKIGFEIVLKNDHNNFNLGYLRSEQQQIDVTGLTDYDLKVKREEILKFIDPVAFYGMHYKQGVKYYNEGSPNNTLKTTISGDRFIYTKLLEKFYTKNKVYIDIRSEKGYSYNFYQNYKVSDTNDNNIQIRVEGGNDINDVFDFQQYQKDNWPILILDSIHTSGSANKLRLKLRIGVNDNTNPILYTKTTLKKSLANNSALSSKYIKTDRLIDNGTNPDLTDWTNEFRIFFPNTLSGNSRNYIGNYVRFHYFRTKHIANNTNTGVLENTHYYDSAFCSIDIPKFDLSNDVGYVKSANPIYVREQNNDDGTGNFQLNMINGAYWDSSRVLLYANIEYENTAEISGKDYINTYAEELNFNPGRYKGSDLKRRLKTICKEYQINNFISVKIPGINFYRSNDLGDSGKDHKENLMLLGLSKAEIQSIRGNQTNIDHHRFIHLGREKTILDTEFHETIPDVLNNNVTYKYYKYTVQIQELDSSQNSSIITPTHNGSPITVYSRDNQFFSSNAFSENEPVTEGVNRIEFHVYDDGVIKINDNKDFALPRGFENIYYFYYNTPPRYPLTVTEICNLSLAVANKMKRNIPFSNLGSRYPNGFMNGRNYNTDMIDGVSAGQVHIDSLNGDVVVEGTTVSGNTSYQTRRYVEVLSKSLKQSKIFMVRMVTQEGNGELWSINSSNQKIWRTESDPLYNPYRFTNANLNIDMRFANTVRFYANPTLAAAVMGALIRFFRLNEDADFIECQGFAYPDATSYPSTNHVNGLAFDITYKGTMDARGTLNLTESENINQDGGFLEALNFFGFTRFYIGLNGASFYGTSSNYISRLDDDYMGTVRDRNHEDHIHAQDFIIRE